MRKVILTIVFASLILYAGYSFAEEKLPVVVNGDQVEYFEDEKKVEAQAMSP